MSVIRYRWELSDMFDVMLILNRIGFPFGSCNAHGTLHLQNVVTA